MLDVLVAPTPAAPNFGSPLNHEAISWCTCTKRGGGWGAIHFGYFYRLTGDIMLGQAATLRR